MIFKKAAQTISSVMLLVFIALLFPLLGTDNPTLVEPRLWLGLFVFFFFIVIHCKEGLLEDNITVRVAAYTFLAVPIFAGIRALWAYFVVHQTPVSNNPFLPLHLYIQWPTHWLFYFTAFVTGYLAFRTKLRAWSALNLMGWMGFFLAVNALPALLLTGKTSYIDIHDKRGFFFPVFYTWDWVSEHAMNRFAHPNYVGDIMAFGFFAALGLVLYCVHVLRLRKKGADLNDRLEQKLSSVPIPFILLRGTLAVAMATAIFMLMSRGTIVSFILTVLIIGLILCVKFFERLPWAAALLAVSLAVGVLGWAVNFEKVFSEIQSLSTEMQSQEDRGTKSIDTNIEGQKRAWVIHQAYPVWGVGTKGYEALARYFAQTKDPFSFADVRAMNHYLQTLAEEGVGAYFYFAFLIVYLLELFKGLFLTRSRFKFVVSLSFFAPVLMVFIHAFFNHLMEGFGMRAMVYLNMGASLSVLRTDFKHR